MADDLAAKLADKLQHRWQQDAHAHIFQTQIDAQPGDAPLVRLVNYIASFDPTKKSYGRWLAGLYANGGIRYLEDLPRARAALQLFDKYKTRIAQKDIQQYKSLTDLEAVVEPFSQTGKGEVSNKDQEPRFYASKQAILLHNDDTIKIVQPRSKEASKFFGTNTKWCTAARDDKQNMFDDYTENGKLYYILLKKQNQRFAVLETKANRRQMPRIEIFNEQDKTITVKQLLRQHPEALKYIPLNPGLLAATKKFQGQSLTPAETKAYRREIDRATKLSENPGEYNGPAYGRFVLKYGEEADISRLSDHTIEKYAAATLDWPTLKRLLGSGKKSAIEGGLENRAFWKQTAKMFYQHRDPEIRRLVAARPVNKAIVEKFLHDPDAEVRLLAVTNNEGKIKPSAMVHLLSDPDPRVRRRLTRVNKKMAQQLLQDSDAKVRESAQEAVHYFSKRWGNELADERWQRFKEYGDRF